MSSLRTIAYLLLSAAALLTSCEKKEKQGPCLGSCTTIEGLLLTSGSAPLPNAPVSVRWNNTALSRRQTKAEGVTDANGRFQLSCFLSDEELASGYLSVVYEVDKSRYHTVGEASYAFFDYSRDTTLVTQPYLIPRKAFIKLVITNPGQLTGPNSYTTDFTFSYATTTFLRQGLGGGTFVNWYALPLQNPLEIAGDEPILVRHFKAGRIPAPADTLFIPAGTTKTYTVTY